MDDGACQFHKDTGMHEEFGPYARKLGKNLKFFYQKFNSKLLHLFSVAVICNLSLSYNVACRSCSNAICA